MVEDLHGLVHRRPVDEGVMRRGRDTQDVAVLVAKRAAQVGVHLTEAQHQRLAAGRRMRGDRYVEGREPRQALLGGRGHGTSARRRRRRWQVQRLQYERRYAASPRTAVIGRVGEHELVARPRHGDIEQSPLLGERPLGRRRVPSPETRGER